MSADIRVGTIVRCGGQPDGRHCNALIYRVRLGLWRNLSDRKPHSCSKVQARKGRKKERQP